MNELREEHEMITEKAMNDRISQILQIVSACTCPFSMGKDTKFLGYDVQVSARVEIARIEDEDDTVIALIRLEMYLGDYQYKKNIAVMDIADDYFEFNWNIRLGEIQTDFKRIFYDLMMTMLRDAMNK